MIPGGYFLFARQYFDSEMSHKPFAYQRIWIEILGMAAHDTFEQNGETILRGDCPPISIKDMQKMTYARYGNRIEYIDRNTISRALDYMIDEEMITVKTKGNKKTISVCKWPYYQDPGNYKNNLKSERTATEHPTEQQFTDDKTNPTEHPTEQRPNTLPLLYNNLNNNSARPRSYYGNKYKFNTKNQNYLKNRYPEPQTYFIERREEHPARRGYEKVIGTFIQDSKGHPLELFKRDLHPEQIRGLTEYLPGLFLYWWCEDCGRGAPVGENEVPEECRADHERYKLAWSKLHEYDEVSTGSK